MRKIYSFLLLGLLLSIGNAWGANGDTHDFSQTLQQLLNNNASIAGINIAAQAYPINKVIVHYRYNKTIENAVTVNVTVNGNDWGNQNVVGTGSNYTNLEFSGESVVGAVAISFTNNTGDGTGHGTFYVDNVQLVEGSLTPTCATPTFTPAAGSYISAQNVSIACTTEGSVIHYTTDGTNPTALSAVYSSPIAVSSNTTIKAIAVADGYDNSAVASATYSIFPVEHAGTQQDPYTVADARNAIDANIGITSVYATGIVSEIVTPYNSQYGNISYNISADGLTTSDQLQAYRGKSYNGDNFTGAGDIQVGDVVVVYGTLKKYNDTYEFDQNNQLVSLNRPAAVPVINAENVELAYNATSGEIAYTISNATEATLTAASTTDFIRNIQVA